MLIQMIVAVAEHRPDVRGAYLDYLKKHLCLSTAQKSESEGEIIMGRWDELYPDLQEFYEYGGGDYHSEKSMPGRPKLWLKFEICCSMSSRMKPDGKCLPAR